jgi:hypothetical protein
LCRAYLESPDASYRATVCDDAIEIAYPEHDRWGSWGGLDDEAAIAAVLSHTALYRWLTGLAKGAVPPAIKGARVRVSPGKHRSVAREQVLQQCLAVLRQMDEGQDLAKGLFVHPRVGNSGTEKSG